MTVTELIDELDLKHIAPYLPYGLKMKASSPSRRRKDIEVLNIENIGDFLILRRKPILRPLSDLTKDDKFTELINEELICGAWKFEHDDWTTSIKTSNNEYTMLVIQNEVAPECTVLFYNYMIENHYDVFGLIEQGLAIDFYTLEK